MSRFKKAEIHSHSTFSDGEFTPSVLAQRCADEGVLFWSLTDHDTCAGCAEASTAAHQLGIEFIPGIEMSAFCGRSVHVLGYNVDLESGVIDEYSVKRIKLRYDRMLEMIQLLNRDGFEMSIESVLAISGEGAIGRPHLAQALIDAGHANDIADAFDRFIGNDAKYYLETPWPSVTEAIQIIHRAGGKAVLAHPGIYGLDDQIEKWVGEGLDGIECDHPRHDEESASRYHDFATQFGLRATGSSDFHGPARTGGDRFGKVELDASLLGWLRD